MAGVVGDAPCVVPAAAYVLSHLHRLSRAPSERTRRLIVALAQLISGGDMSWRVARSLDVLLGEINAAAPNRSKAADGSIGDTAHSSRASDHNPNDAGVVRARDFTNDPAGGCDSSDLAERVRQRGISGHPALGPGAYVISDGRIASATYGWVWRPYSGSNPHDHHCHVSVSTAATGYDSTAPWGAMEDDMPLSEADLDKIVKRLAPVIRSESRAAVDDVLDVDINANEPKGDADFRGMTLRKLLKALYKRR